MNFLKKLFSKKEKQMVVFRCSICNTLLNVEYLPTTGLVFVDPCPNCTQLCKSIEDSLDILTKKEEE